MGPHGWAADLQTVEQAYAMANMAKADVPADEERGADLRNVGPYGWAANLQTNERPYRSADSAKADVPADAAAYSADVPADAAAIAFAVRDPDGAAHGSADGGAHRNSVVCAYGRAFVSADIPAFGRYYSRTDRGAHREAHGGADGREADRGTHCGAHGGADGREGYHDCAAAELPTDERPYKQNADVRTIERAYRSADSRGDRGAELPHVGPHDCAAKLFAF